MINGSWNPFHPLIEFLEGNIKDDKVGWYGYLEAMHAWNCGGVREERFCDEEKNN
jgi:hypothetical protein